MNSISRVAGVCVVAFSLASCTINEIRALKSNYNPDVDNNQVSLIERRCGAFQLPNEDSVRRVVPNGDIMDENSRFAADWLAISNARNGYSSRPIFSLSAPDAVERFENGCQALSDRVMLKIAHDNGLILRK